MTDPDGAPGRRGDADVVAVYYVCFTEPAGPDSSELMKEQFAAHKAWVVEHERDLLLAGPFLTTDDLGPTGRGMLVLRANSVAEAERLVLSDPMHTSGARTFSIVPWRINEGTITTTVTISGKSAEFG